jgi:carnitine O-acetyltransferase
MFVNLFQDVCATQLTSVNQQPIMTIQPRSTRPSSTLPEGYKADPTQGPMLRYQESLPCLPVPSLSSTLAKYLETIRPHLTPAEYARSESAVRKFGASTEAAELQRRLEARGAEPGVVNWLADWWNEVAYMAYRDPVVVNVSYFYVHVADPAVRDAPRRAATLIKAMLPFRTLVETCVTFLQNLYSARVRVPLSAYTKPLSSFQGSIGT